MWQPGYLESLAPLQGALSEMGAMTCLERASLVNDDVKERDFSYAENLVEFVSFLLDRLDDADFFVLLANLPRFATLLKDKCSQACNAIGVKRADDIKGSLAPIFELLSCLAPSNVHDTLFHLKVHLELQGGNDSLEYLVSIQEALEKVQPKSIWSCLGQLHDLLKDQHEHLVWLTCYSGECLCPSNLFYELHWVGETLKSVLATPENLLLHLQGALEELDEIRAIGPRPGDPEN